MPVSADGSFSVAKPLNEGENTITLTAVDLAGNSTTQNLLLTRDTISPVFANVTPDNGSTSATASIRVTGSVSEASTTTVTLNGLSTTVQGTAFDVPVALFPGANSISIVAVDRAGNRATLSISVTLGAGLDLVVESPADGTTVAGDSVNIVGRVTGATNPGISVNGLAAAMSSDRFAVTVPLAVGSNSLTVKAVTAGGASATKMLNIQSVSSNRWTPSFEPEVLYAPAKVTLSVPEAIQVQVDFDGNGSVDGSGTGPQELAYSFSQPGIYFARTTVTDASGTYVVSTPLVVQDVRALDPILRGVFDAMVGRLRVGDIEGALKYFSPQSAEHYREVFQDLAAQLPAVADQIGTLKQGSVTGEMAEYLLVREAGGTKQGFLVYMRRGFDGLWRISQM